MEQGSGDVIVRRGSLVTGVSCPSTGVATANVTMEARYVVYLIIECQVKSSLDKVALILLRDSVLSI